MLAFLGLGLILIIVIFYFILKIEEGDLDGTK